MTEDAFCEYTTTTTTTTATVDHLHSRFKGRQPPLRAVTRNPSWAASCWLHCHRPPD